jgi:glutamyl-tRNA reductase
MEASVRSASVGAGRNARAMDRIAAAGLSIHEVDAQQLERLARAPQVADDARRELADGLAASELVVLRTCNRIELVLARESGAPPSPRERATILTALGIDDPELASQLHLYCGRAAVRHVFRVTCSLDSLVMGEDQILAQVRGAWSAAQEEGLTGSLLDPLFEAAVQVGKRVRTETELSRHPVSVVALGVQALRERAPTARRVAVVGAGKTSRLAGQTLRAEGLEVAAVVHRTAEGARALATELDARPLDLSTFKAGAETVDAVVSATSAPGIVLETADLVRIARRPENGGRFLGIDLALPRDLATPNEPWIEVVDLEALRGLADANRARRAEAAAIAETIVEDKITALERRLVQRHTERLVSEVLAETSERLEHELRALSTGRLARLDPRDREAVERWARATFGRLAHAPMQAAKRLAAQETEWSGEDEEDTTG